MSWTRLTTLALALAAGLAVVAVDVAEARLGGGRSLGSRGAKTYQQPPATTTAPKAAPIEKSITKAPTGAQSTPGVAGTPAASPFGGWRGLLMGGLIAAGLASIFGIGALASVLGFVLQFALIAGVVFLVVSFFRNRSQPALARTPAGAPNPAARNYALNRQALGSGGAAAATDAKLDIGQADLDTFERLLGEIQSAYSREDTEKLGDVTTPEMLSYFSQELADNAKAGVVNKVSAVKLLQGDLSEAWRENGSDYATVAMRYSLIDATVDRATGRVVSGDEARPSEAIELWTFRRDDRAPAEGWQLSAIQQAA